MSMILSSHTAAVGPKWWNVKRSSFYVIMYVHRLYTQWSLYVFYEAQKIYEVNIKGQYYAKISIPHIIVANALYIPLLRKGLL